MSVKRRKPKGHDTDTLMKNVWLNLVRDFRVYNGVSYHRETELALLRSVPEFRGVVFPDRLNASPWLFKQEAQLEALFKRYRFKNDLYTDDELEQLTIDKFMSVQARIGSRWQSQLSETTFRVLQKARHIIKEILSAVALPGEEAPYRFSTRATVGCPASDAYLDHKLAGEITGSHEHLEWFKQHLNHSVILSDSLEKCSPPGGPIFTRCTSLPLIGVPKSFKSYRLISPNTLVGSYYTYGVGQVLVEALKLAGLDIRKLQRIHRRLAERFSKRGGTKYVTADLSSASESYTWDLICRLCPREWLHVLEKGRLRYFRYGDGNETYYCSFMAMGIGFTFPLQTLLFYGIIKACRVLMGKGGFESVYGDDLIYRRDLHPVVKSVFQEIGFQLNADKTFVDSDFRESCGGDYLLGCDVRPFSPEGEHRLLSKRSYESELYKIYNGLLQHWPEEALPLTLRYLRTEICGASPDGTICQVPRFYPETSGVRTSRPISDPMEGFRNVVLSFKDGSRWFTFRALEGTSSSRYVSFIHAYYWAAMRQLETNELSEEQKEQLDLQKRYIAGKNYRFLDKDFVRSVYDSSTEVVQWMKHPLQPKNYRARNGRRLRKLIAATGCKLRESNFRLTKGSISDWI